VDLEKLLGELTTCCQPILDSPDEFPKVEIVADQIPEIHLQDMPTG
jgi:hypothetical protein